MKVYKEYIEKSFDNTEDLFEYLNSDEESQELIRCKDCTYYRGDHEYCRNDMFAIESGFCNWAERKEE